MVPGSQFHISTWGHKHGAVICTSTWAGSDVIQVLSDEIEWTESLFQRETDEVTSINFLFGKHNEEIQRCIAPEK
jgi:hypothetical protein